MVNEAWVDSWRFFNVGLALIAIGFDGRWMVRNWRTLSNHRKAQMGSLIGILVAVIYGSLENVFAPELNLRVPILSLAVVGAIAAYFLPNTSQACNHTDPNQYPN